MQQLVQKEYKTTHDWVGKVINWELCKKLKFDHMNKWYMHNPEFVQDNEMHKLVWVFEILTDHIILARQPDLQKKRTGQVVDVAVLADHRVKLKEGEKRDKYLDLARELKKLWNMTMTVVPIVVGALETIHKGLVKVLEDLEIRRQVESLQATALLRLARILGRVLET